VDGAGLLTFAPRLPSALTGLSFRLVYRGRRLRIGVTPAAATYEVTAGDPVDLEHYGSRLTLRPGVPDTRPIPAITDRPAPPQPPGCAPRRPPPVANPE
jgi:alpha,alpha-trehalose phosphorylase